MKINPITDAIYLNYFKEKIQKMYLTEIFNIARKMNKFLEYFKIKFQ